MMLRKRRRPVLYVSDSSDDDSPHRKCPNRPYYGANRSHRTRNEIQEDSDMASDSDFIHTSRKKCKRLRLYSSEELDSTDDEEVVHPIRHGSVRALSDYESGTSSDGSDATGDNTQKVSSNGEGLEMGNSLQGTPYTDVISTNSGSFFVSLEQNGNVSESSSTSSITSPNQIKRCKRLTNAVYSSDSSGSDEIRIRSRKSNRLPSTDDESDSANTSDFGSHGVEVGSFSASAHRSGSSMQYQDRRQESRNYINTQNQIQIRMTDSDSNSNNDNSSDSDIPIRNNSFRNRFRDTTIFSCSDTEEVSSTRLRRGAVIPLNESDGDDVVANENVSETNVASQSQQSSAVPKPCQNDLTDSDSDSESCAICLGNLNLEEIGVPSSCEHRFCLLCIQEWAKNNNTCPVDRKEFNELIVHNKQQGNIIRRIPVENITPRNNIFDAVDLWQYVAAAELMITNHQNRTAEVIANNDIIDEDNWRSIFELSTVEEDEDGDGPEEICHICFEDDEDDSGMIVCDECSRAFHLSCVRLSYIPVQTWYCQSCASLN